MIGQDIDQHQLVRAIIGGDLVEPAPHLGRACRARSGDGGDWRAGLASSQASASSTGGTGIGVPAIRCANIIRAGAASRSASSAVGAAIVQVAAIT